MANKRTPTAAGLDRQHQFKKIQKKKQNASIPLFVQKLHHMLSSPNANDIKAIVSWNDNDNGQTFIVKNSQLFSQRIIPKYFDCTLSSFKRQLNYYSFVRVTDDDSNNLGLNKSSKKSEKKSKAMKYRHERGKFQRDHPEMLYEIRRSTCNDPKIELGYLRDKVNSLEDECFDLRKDLMDFKTQMEPWIKIMQQQHQLHQIEPLGAAASLNGVNAYLPLPQSKSMGGVGCVSARMRSTEITLDMAAKEQDWELFQDNMFTDVSHEDSRKPSADRTISNPGMLDTLLNYGEEKMPLQQEEDEDNNHGNCDNFFNEKMAAV